MFRVKKPIVYDLLTFPLGLLDNIHDVSTAFRCLVGRKQTGGLRSGLLQDNHQGVFMGVYLRMRRAVIVTLCACSAVAGIGMAVAPGSALAVACENPITGSGSSLQAEQQTEWTKTVGAVGFKLGTCAAPNENPKIVYTATSSGKGLTEFGIEGIELKKAEAGNGKGELDAFIGTDDPPTKPELEKTSKVGRTAGTNAVVVPVIAAPIAVIVHLPKGCEILSEELKISNFALNELWLGKYANWKLFLEAAIGSTNFNETPAKSCEVEIKLEVRLDSSGTSYAFKQYLCQIDPAAWGKVILAEECESGKEYVTDAELWPPAAAVLTEHLAGELNEQSKGEAEAVSQEEGSVGYVNLANAFAAGFRRFLTNKTTFWARIENNEEPVHTPVSLELGNCPTTYNFKAGAIKVEAEEGKWAKVHLAKPAQVGAYPICTLTYDVAWESYKTKELEKEYGAAKFAGVGNATEFYFEWMVGQGLGEGQEEANLANFYSPLPEIEVTTIAEKLAKKVNSK
jgi:ABC-type phosphate transport system substrate-binding protein